VRRNFVDFCEARTGSYNLVSRLDSCADVVCHEEVFKKNRIEVSDFHARKLKLKIRKLEERNRRPVEFIEELRRLNPFKSFGFKLFATHLSWAPGAMDYVLARDTRRIVLFREPLEIYASGLRARQTGVWTNPTGRRVPEDKLAQKVSFTPESFENFALHYNRYAAMCRLLAALPSTFVIHYGQTGDPGAMNELLAFVGSRGSFAATSSEFRKQYRGSLEEAFSNWDELEARIGSLTPLAEGPAPTRPLEAAEAAS
jgi:hypothetical protein